MRTSESIKEISKALLKAQKAMTGTVAKGAANPFFKSKYADLNAVREACLPQFNDAGIVVLQPTVIQDGKNFVETILIHESGEFMASLTEIKVSKQNDAQAEGSGISYARRYGLQSFANLASVDDDGENAVGREATKSFSQQKKEQAEVKTSVSSSGVQKDANKDKVAAEAKVNVPAKENNTLLGQQAQAAVASKTTGFRKPSTVSVEL